MPACRFAVVPALLLALPLAAQVPELPVPNERKSYVALRIATPIRLDGRLGEVVWQAAPVATGFRQVEPEQDAPARFRTEVRVLFDDQNLYFGVTSHDSAGRDGVRVQDLRRKFDYNNNDLVGISLDPLGDGRTAVAFQVTPYGSLRELQVLDDQVYNRQWEAVWSARTEVTDSGWTAEIAIPWATLRYRNDGGPWGANFYRIARRENELSAWSPWPRQFTAYRVPYFGTLEGLVPPGSSSNIRVRPYVVGETVKSGADPAPLGDGAVKAGGEVIWSPTSSSVLEATINTDFAQADVDRQVVNLRLFSVFFPERRQFFLENANLFDVGLSGSESGFIVQPFFSRRIGLDPAGAAIPIQAGLRYVARATRPHSAPSSSGRKGPPRRVRPRLACCAAVRASGRARGSGDRRWHGWMPPATAQPRGAPSWAR